MQSSGLSEKSQREGAQNCPTCRNLLKSSASLSSSGPTDAREKEYDLNSQLKQEISTSRRFLEQTVQVSLELQKSQSEVRQLNKKLSLQENREKVRLETLRLALQRSQSEVRQLKQRLALAERQGQYFMHLQRQSQKELRVLEETASLAIGVLEEIAKTDSTHRKHIMIANSDLRPQILEIAAATHKPRLLHHYEAKEVRSYSASTKLSDLCEKEERAAQAGYSPKKRGSQDNYNENVSKSESFRYDYWGGECNLYRAGNLAPTDQASHHASRECLQRKCDLQST